MKFEFDALKYSYPSVRRVVYGNRGMVCTSQPLAAQAGLDIMKNGGNAIDAAIATAACMTVLEPTSNGIGGDAFALVWTKNSLHGLNASGPAPMSLNAEKIREKNRGVMPKYGWDVVTVPGAPSAWSELSRKYGKLPLADILQPAVGYAENGYPVSPIVSHLWNNAYRLFQKEFEDKALKNWFTTFAPKGYVPKPGQVVTLPDHAVTMLEIGKTN